jgi:O-antigen chain-terminating methyltransferase
VVDEPLEDLLTRLERARVEADRLYNDALTAVDRAIQRPRALPAPPAQYDEHRLADLNASWNLLPAGAPPLDRSLKGRLRAFIWRLIGPPLTTQVRFNAALVDHFNRNAVLVRQMPRSIAEISAAVQAEHEALLRFESKLVQFLQTVTAYVDTKDRSYGGHELRQRLALAEQRLAALRREVEAAASKGSGGPHQPGARSSDAAFSGSEAVTYLGFEDRFRGARAEISRRVEEYLPLFSSAADVIDVGCGRGELLEQLRGRGVVARGVDANRAMVEECRARGLSVELDDALTFLQRQPDDSAGGLVAIQVVEHFAPAYLMRFLEHAFRVLRPGAALVLETINPACWLAFFETYLRDLTHERALHPETLRFLVEAAGFTSVAVQFRQPVGEADRLARLSGPDAAGALAAALNDHADKLNARLFSSMDYAVVARR